MTSGAFTAAHFALLPQVEKLTGKRVVTATTSIGTGETSIPNRLKRGEAADIVICPDWVLKQFIAEGLVEEEGYAMLASSSIALAVREGAPKPDIATVEAFTKTLLAAKSIGYSASESGRYYSTELVQRLGIADRVMPKSRWVGNGERVGNVIARGEVEVGMQQLSELLPIRGIAHITPLPKEIQKTAWYPAGVAAHSRDKALARKVIAFLASPAGAQAIRNSGLEPAGAS